MDYQEKLNSIIQIVKEKRYEEAKVKLNALLKENEYERVSEDGLTHYSVNNYIELILIKKYGIYVNENKAPKINVAKVYYYLGYIALEEKRYDDAIEFFNESLRWNPADINTIFLRAEVYRIKGRFQRYRAEIEKSHRYIYEKMDLAKYYRKLGMYYFNLKVYDVSLVLYENCNRYFENEIANKQIEQIKSIEGIKEVSIGDNEIKEFFTNFNIPYGYDDEAISILKNEQSRLEINKRDENYRLITRVLYGIFESKNYMLYKEIKNEQFELKASIPEVWMSLDKEKFEKYKLANNVVFLIFTPKKQNIIFKCIGKTDVMNYQLLLQKLREQGNTILKERSINKNKNYYRFVIERKIKDDLFRENVAYFELEGMSYIVSWNIFNSNNLELSLTKEQTEYAIQFIDTIVSTKKKETPKFEEKVEIKIENKDKKENEIKHKSTNTNASSSTVIPKANVDKNININLDVKTNLNPKINTQGIQNIARVDANLSSNEIKNKDKIEDINQTNEVREIKENVNNKVEPDLNNKTKLKEDNKNETKNESDIKSKEVVKENKKETVNVKEIDGKIIPSGLNKSKSQNEMEISQMIEGYPTFKFFVPKDLGKPVQLDDNVFEIVKNRTQKLRVAVFKCEFEDFETSAKEWIQKNLDNNGQEIESYTQEMIGKIPLEVYVLKKKNKINKIYKIGYMNGYKVTISGGLIGQKEKIINTIFEKIIIQNNKK